MSQKDKKAFFTIKIKNKLSYDYENEFFINLVQVANGKSDIVVFVSTCRKNRPAGTIIEEYPDILQCEGLSRDIYNTRLSAYRNNIRYQLVR